MKTPRAGSVAKAWTEVRTPERTMKVPSSEKPKARMASRMVQVFSASRFSTTMAECRSAAGEEPGHEARVLDRVPEPEAAPAELVVGPPGAERDADGQEHPGGERPGPDPARPGGVDPPLDQRGDGEGEGHREADIAEVEEGRVEGEARVLQQRVQVAPVDGRHREPQEGVRGEQDEGQEGDADRGLHRQHPRLEGRGQLAPNARRRRAEEREDQDPEEHRALVVPPDAGELVEPGLGAVRVGVDQRDREVRGQEGPGQRREGEADQQELRRWRRARPPPSSLRQPLLRAHQRHHRLQERDAEGQDQREMSELDDHGGDPSAARVAQQWPQASAADARHPRATATTADRPARSSGGPHRPGRVLDHRDVQEPRRPCTRKEREDQRLVRRARSHGAASSSVNHQVESAAWPAQLSAIPSASGVARDVPQPQKRDSSSPPRSASWPRTRSPPRARKPSTSATKPERRPEHEGEEECLSHFFEAFP